MTSKRDESMRLEEKPEEKEAGFALVITMLFALMALAMTAALLYVTVQNTKVVGLEQRYATVLDSAKASSDVMLNFILNYGTIMVPDAGSIPAGHATCLDDKMNKATVDSAGVYAWTNCINTSGGLNAQQTNTSIDPTVEPDIIVTGLGQYTVYAKITTTTKVNDAGTDYYFYAVELLSRNPTNTAETAKISLLFKAGG